MVPVNRLFILIWNYSGPLYPEFSLIIPAFLRHINRDLNIALALKKSIKVTSVIPGGLRISTLESGSGTVFKGCKWFTWAVLETGCFISADKITSYKYELDFQVFLFFFLTDSVFLPKWHLCISFLNKAGQTPSCVHLISNISSKLFEQLRDFLSLLPIFKLNFVCYCFITWLLPCIPTTCKIETSRSSFLSR